MTGVRRSDATSGAAVGTPLTGDTEAVSNMCVCTDPDGRPKLASAS